MKRLFTSCFGLGFLPVAPGTWGSLPVAVIFGLLCYFRTGVMASSIVMIVIAITASAVCVVFGPSVIETTGSKDPSEVVADEAPSTGNENSLSPQVLRHARRIHPYLFPCQKILRPYRPDIRIRRLPGKNLFQRRECFDRQTNALTLSNDLPASFTGNRWHCKNNLFYVMLLHNTLTAAKQQTGTG